ncbi:MAG: hypothetical protein KDD47_25630, partial [Acidobacteria bacterium]|nr:hypothetical protein [Acidobacteriota bacterium]
MSLRLIDTPEPLAPAAHNAKQVLLAESEVCQQLERVLRRYLERKIHGRSILISGYRGSGKTTSVHKALQRVNEAVPKQENRRLLLVTLHGPDLLPAGKEPERKGGEDSTNQDTPGAETLSRAETDRQTILKRITAGLYRALSRELSRTFRGALERKDGTDSSSSGETGSEAELSELAAQFELALDGQPDLKELRGFWHRAGGLDRGLLFPEAGTRTSGPAEIVAVASAARAYRRITGKEKSQLEAGDLDQWENEFQSSFSSSISDIARGLTSLFAASALLGGVLLENNILALIAAVATVGATFSWKGSRVRKTKVEAKSFFFPDTSPATLERELPVLVERLHAAGLSPVFLIDELDKVEDLRPRLKQVIHHLKHLAAAGVFFCFLTDRDYFEDVYRLDPSKSYPKEHTYFGDRLFVVHRPQALKKHLNDVIEIGKDREKMEKGLLIYSLLCRSVLHPLDLRRALRRLADPAGLLKIDLDEIRGRPGIRVVVTYQIAVEIVLASQDTQDRLELDPGIVQPLYDCLYYPYRMWSAGERVLLIDRETLKNHLIGRSHRSASPETAGPESWPRFDLDFLHRRLEDLVGLLTDLEGLRAEADTRPSRFFEDLEVSWAVRSAIFRPDSMEGRGNQRLLEAITNGSQQYRWCRDPYGVRYPDPDAPARGADTPGPNGTGAAPPASSSRDPAPEKLPEELPRDQVLAIGRHLQKVSDYIFAKTESLDLEALASELFLLPPIPSWRHVRTVVAKLKGLQDPLEPDERFNEDWQALTDFLQLIHRRSSSLERALVLGILAGHAYGSKGTTSKADAGLRAVSRHLQGAGKQSDLEFDQALDAVEESLPEGVGLPENFSRTRMSPFLSEQEFGDWCKRIDESVGTWSASSFASVETLQQEAWEQWDLDLKQYFVSHGFQCSFPPHWRHLATAAAQRPPGSLLRSPLD